MKTQVQVIFYSLYGHVHRLARAVAAGAVEVAETEVRLLQVSELMSDEALAKSGAKESRQAFLPTSPDLCNGAGSDGAAGGGSTASRSADEALSRGTYDDRLDFGQTAVGSFEKCDLLGHRQLFSAAGPRLQTQPTAVVRTPLALAAIRAGMFLGRGGHNSIIPGRFQ
jgi:hypothetical protein